MNTKSTWRLLVAAIAVFAFIYFFEGPHSKHRVAARPLIFEKLQAANVTGIELRATNLIIRAEKTNETWRLLTPFYPAQSTPIESLINAVTALPRLEIIPAAEVASQANKFKDFGLDPPVASFTIFVGTNRYYLNIGSRLVLGDQVYAQIPGAGDALVTDAAILRALPASANDWRSPQLLQLAERPFDHFQIRSGQRLLEFERDTTNKLWRISKPTSARANNERITQLLQKLGTARVKQFVTDSPAADLERYGLQTPELELSFSVDTNRVTSLEFGASPTNEPGDVYVRRMANTNIVVVERKLLEELSLPKESFRDTQLISVDPAQIAMMQFKGTNFGFTIARQTNGVWRFADTNALQADTEIVNAIAKLLTSIEIVEFTKDVPTDADLKQFGLTTPDLSVALFANRTNAAGVATNAPITQVDFGAHKGEDAVYVHRSDETPVYVTPLADVLLLPRETWRLRDRTMFNFGPTNVSALVVSMGGQTNRLSRQGNQWSADAIQNEMIDEAVTRLGHLRAANWEGKGQARMASLGFTRDGPTFEAQVTRDGAPIPVLLMFGNRVIRNHNMYAATVLPGETEITLFQFPGDIYDLMVRAGLMPAR